jgi:hypothetical protein
LQLGSSGCCVELAPEEDLIRSKFLEANKKMKQLEEIKDVESTPLPHVGFVWYWRVSVGRNYIRNIVHKSVMNPKLTDKGKTQFRFFVTCSWNSAPLNSHHDHQGLHKTRWGPSLVDGREALPSVATACFGLRS